MKEKITAAVVSQESLAEGIYSLVVKVTENMIQDAGAGQFVGLYPEDGGRLLPRPISLCRVDKENAQLRMVYRAAGAGTKEIAGLKAGDTIDVLGILGNGYDLQQFAGKKALLLGGGIGIPPMLELAAELKGVAAEVTVALGYRDGQLFLADEFAQAADKVVICTEDGSCGFKGNAVDGMKDYMKDGASYDVIACCGPMPMLRAVKKFAGELSVPAYLSLEERMACGVGVCLGCVATTTKKDEHSNNNNARVCTEGPVFEASEVQI